MKEIKLDPLPPEFREIHSKMAKKWYKEASPEKLAKWKANLSKASKKRYENEDKEIIKQRMAEMSRKRWGKK